MTSTDSCYAVDYVHPICYFDLDIFPTFPKGHKKLCTLDGCHFLGTRSQKLFAIHLTQFTTPFTPPPPPQPAHLHGSAPCV